MRANESQTLNTNLFGNNKMSLHCSRKYVSVTIGPAGKIMVGDEGGLRTLRPNAVLSPLH